MSDALFSESHLRLLKQIDSWNHGSGETFVLQTFAILAHYLFEIANSEGANQMLNALHAEHARLSETDV